MSGTIELINESEMALDEARLHAAVEQVLRQEAAPAGASLSLVISGNDTVQALNRQYRGIDAPTDVLSFPSGESLSGPAPYLGDILIAYPYAAAQAEREGHDLTQSLMLLALHGTLHLLAYDHDTPEAQAAMWAAQDRALTALDLPLTLVPSYDHD